MDYCKKEETERRGRENSKKTTEDNREKRNDKRGIGK